MLTAPAHPDAERERALSALGADPTPCVQILDAWNEHSADLDVLMLASRGPSDRINEWRPHGEGHPATAAFAFGRQGSGPHTYRALSSVVTGSSGVTGWWAGSSMRPRRYVDYEGAGSGSGLFLLLSLGFGLPHRLSATVIATWAERVESGDERAGAATPALDAALYGRVRTTLLPWLGAAATVQLTMLPPGTDPGVGRDGADIRAELPFAWLRDVWANGFAVILDRFCVHAEQTADRSWILTTVDRDLADQQTVTVSG
jgi:hypothetical protein